MYADYDISAFRVSKAEIDAALRRARAERAEVVRDAAVRVALFVKRLFAARPMRQPVRQAGARA